MPATEDLYLIRKGASLVARDPQAQNTLARIPEGATVKVVLSRPREINRHRGFWRLCQKLGDALRELGKDDEDKDSVVARLKVACGHARLITISAITAQKLGLPTRVIAMPAVSIAFHNMSEPEFQDFVRRCRAFIAIEILPHLNAADVGRDVENMLTGRDLDERRRGERKDAA